MQLMLFLKENHESAIISKHAKVHCNRQAQSNTKWTSEMNEGLIQAITWVQVWRMISTKSVISHDLFLCRDSPVFCRAFETFESVLNWISTARLTKQDWQCFFIKQLSRCPQQLQLNGKTIVADFTGKFEFNYEPTRSMLSDIRKQIVGCSRGW